MSTTTDKDIIQQLTETAKSLASTKDKLLAALHEKLQDAHKLVNHYTSLIEEHSGKPSVAPVKRGRKSTKVKAIKPTAKKGKRGGVKDSVVAYLTKHSMGTLPEITAALPALKKGSINQCLYGLLAEKKVTKKSGRGTPFVWKG